MRLSLTSWSMPQCSLDEACAISNALGIGSLDIGYFYRSAIDKSAVLSSPDTYAKAIKELPLDVPCLYHLFGESLEDRNLALASSLDKNRKDFSKVLEFCQQAGIETAFILPGVVNPGQTRGDAIKQSAENLNVLVEMSKGTGVQVAIEPHVHSCIESPAQTEALLDEVEGLKLVLDHAHYVCLGYRQEEIDPLLAHAAHIHLRQAKMGYLQTRLEQGTINYLDVFAQLAALNYQGYLALEYVHQDYMGTLHEDVLSETIKLRDVFSNWKEAAHG
ncbi:putative Xylose isomerase [Vibrio nigripulchritudo MADA3029]|uniref:sugar phosphate isomerase/epimerase family protein n=1 Tax=Vibrio nigripulchritudo TaxID=28173 RepID=UPI0003B1A6B4|nr:sugar phosphate isomerase/epimerase family protein [Vibrio nigripulchritudo]CCN45882.1 putative Xylose isomerase [Vibrio nigripulchritudo MADA3020]CCN56067.1 putative Xylose isomerase [Vibrio nigripulchritudo MADA3021]CCN59810.1 putative Xylose isomerase [Vibrio nigripulchritudo MADA3029]